MTDDEPEWQEHRTSAGDPYYYHAEHSKTTWERPAGCVSSVASRSSAAASRASAATPARAGTTVRGLREFVTAEGRKYVFDPTTNTTSWLEDDFSERSGVLPSAKDRASTVFRNRRSTALRSIDSAGSGSAPDELSRHTTASLDEGSAEQRLEVLVALQKLVHARGADGETRLSANAVPQSARLAGLRDELRSAAKTSHRLQSEVHELEHVIGLHIHNRMAVQSKVAERRGLHEASKERSAARERRLGAEEKKKYETLLFLVRNHPPWLAEIAARVAHDQQPQLVQLIVFAIYADMHDAEDDLLLLQLFGVALASEVARCSDITTFMRANSALTVLLQKYNQREPARDALVAILGPPLRELAATASDESLEVEPLKVYRDITPPDQQDATIDAAHAAALPAVAATIEARAARASALAGAFLDAVTSDEAVEKLTFGSRWVAKTILDCARRGFGRATTEEQLLALVGGFLFLRYINPVVVAPESLGLLAAPPSRQLRKNLVLVAKLLQCASNNSRPGEKEEFMGVFNSFVDEHRGRMRQFFARVVDVPALSLREMEIDKYLSALRSGVEDGPRPLHISLNELYFLHRLLAANPDVVKHADAQAALKALPPPPEGRLPKEEDEEVGLRLGGDVALKLQEEVKDSRGRRLTVNSSGGGGGGGGQGGGGGAGAKLRPAGTSATAWRLATAAEGAPLRRALRAALQLLPPAKISGVHWDDVAVGLRALSAAGREPAAAAAALDDLESRIRQCGLHSDQPHGDGVWAVVAAARDELQAAQFVASQVSKYEASLARLHAALATLRENKAIFETTLEAVKMQSSGAGGAPAAAGGGGAKAPPSSFTFACGALAKRGVFLADADEVAPALSAAAEPDVRKRAKLWAKATFTLELLAPGELALRAAAAGAKGGAPPLWGTTFTLDGLLTQRAKGVRHVELDGVEVNLVQLVDLINESFARQVK